MELWKLASFFLGSVFCIDLVLLCFLLRQTSKQEQESNARHWRFVQSLARVESYQSKARKAAAEEARRVNRAAKVRKWVKLVGLKADTAFLSESVLLRQRFEKILEELAEFDTAIVKGDRVAVADAVADLQVVLETIPILLGYDGEAAFTAVHNSNMTKKPLLFWQDGKGKGANFLEPDFSRVRGLIRKEKEKKMTREEILAKATMIVEGQREGDEGAEDTFELIAALWGAYLDYVITPTDVCMMMALLKIARVKCGRSVGDSLVDIAGYAACAADREL